MNNTYLDKVNTSLVHFLLLTVFGFVVTVFLVHKAEQAVSGIDSFSDVSRYNKLLENADQPAAINTASWKTYRNEKYGFEVRYPREWKIEEETRTAPSSPSISILAIREKPGTVRGMVFGVTISRPFNIEKGTGTEEKEILVDGIASHALFHKNDGYAGQPDVSIAVPHDNFIYLLDISPTYTIEAEFKSILSTFKFIK